MLIGVPKEIKNNEYRVGLTPAGARELAADGHQVLVQARAGHGIGLDDEHYEAVGAQVVGTPEEIFERAEMIVKVKEPQPDECRMLREGQTLFTYLHLAPDPDQTRLLAESGVTAIAYETVTDARGGLPLLRPMSEVAGRMSIQAGAHALERHKGGNGTLLGGVPGVSPGRVVVIGGGVVGVNAARMAMGLGADVFVMERSPDKLVELDELKLLELLELLELELELEKLELNDELDDELVELELLELSELELLDTELEEDELLDEFSNISKFCVYPVTTSAPSVALSLEARTYKYLLSSVSQGTEKE